MRRFWIIGIGFAALALAVTLLLVIHARCGDAAEVPVGRVDGNVVIAQQGKQRAVSNYDYAIRVEDSELPWLQVVSLYDNRRGTVIRSSDADDVARILRNVPSGSEIRIFQGGCGHLVTEDEASLMHSFIQTAEKAGYRCENSEYTICLCPDSD